MACPPPALPPALALTSAPCNGFACAAGVGCVCPPNWGSFGDLDQPLRGANSTQDTCLVLGDAVRGLFAVSASAWLGVMAFALSHVLRWSDGSLWVRRGAADGWSLLGRLRVGVVPMSALFAAGSVRRAVAPLETGFGWDLATTLLFSAAMATFGLHVVGFLLVIVDMAQKNTMMKGAIAASRVGAVARFSRLSLIHI